MGAINEMQADDGGLVKPRPSQPKKKKTVRARRGGAPTTDPPGSRNQRGDQGGGGGGAAGQQQQASQNAAQGAPPTEVRERRQLCEQILANGYVQSFVDFFYLTHRPDPKAALQATGAADAAAPGEIDVSPQEMVFLSKHLTTAEKARRLGDTNVVYQSFNVLAQYFQQLEDPKTGVYFYEKCLEIARLTNDRGAEMLAHHCLGAAHEGMGELLPAAAYHERHRDLAAEDALEEEQRTANAELVKIYWKFAEQKEAARDGDLAVQFYEKCLQAARAAGDRASEGVAAFKLGRAFAREGQPQQAVPFLEDYLAIGQALGDLEGQGHAYAELARAHRRMGDDDTAQEFLEQFLEVALQTDNLMAQGEACKGLGALYSRKEEFHKAVEVFEKYFETCRSLVNAGQGATPLVDLARTYLGLARANALLGRYYHALRCDLGELLEWKTRRKEPQGGAP